MSVALAPLWLLAASGPSAAVDYLLYTHEVIGNIRQSCPVNAWLAGIGLLALLPVWLARGPLYGAARRRPGAVARATCLALAVPPPTLSLWLADLDQMHGSGNAYVAPSRCRGILRPFPVPPGLRRRAGLRQQLPVAGVLQLTTLLPRQRVETYAVRPDTLEATPTAEHPTLTREAMAYYQTAAESLKHGLLLHPAYR